MTNGAGTGEKESNKRKNDSKEVRVPTKNDVLYGRGPHINSHAGNEQFRQIVEKHKKVYLNARFKEEKRLVASSIVADIRALGGRFLARKPHSGSWYDVGDEKARHKTSQALRENAPTLRGDYHPRSEDHAKTEENTTSNNDVKPRPEDTRSRPDTTSVRPPVYLPPPQWNGYYNYPYRGNAPPSQPPPYFGPLGGSYNYQTGPPPQHTYPPQYPVRSIPYQGGSATSLDDSRRSSATSTDSASWSDATHSPSHGPTKQLSMPSQELAQQARDRHCPHDETKIPEAFYDESHATEKNQDTNKHEEEEEESATESHEPTPTRRNCSVRTPSPNTHVDKSPSQQPRKLARRGSKGHDPSQKGDKLEHFEARLPASPSPTSPRLPLYNIGSRQQVPISPIKSSQNLVEDGERISLEDKTSNEQQDSTTANSSNKDDPPDLNNTSESASGAIKRISSFNERNMVEFLAQMHSSAKDYPLTPTMRSPGKSLGAPSSTKYYPASPATPSAVELAEQLAWGRAASWEKSLEHLSPSAFQSPRPLGIGQDLKRSASNDQQNLVTVIEEEGRHHGGKHF